MSRCDSAAIVSNTNELLPEPDMPVKTVSRRFGISTLTSLRLFSRAPWTLIQSWLSATSLFADLLVAFVAALTGVLLAALLIGSPAMCRHASAHDQAAR